MEKFKVGDRVCLRDIHRVVRGTVTEIIGNAAVVFWENGTKSFCGGIIKAEEYFTTPFTDGFVSLVKLDQQAIREHKLEQLGI